MEEGEDETTYTLSPSQQERLNERLVLYTALTADFPISLGYSLSKAEKNSEDASLTYGELVRSTQDFLSFAEVLELSKDRFGLQSGGTFIDLGCVSDT